MSDPRVARLARLIVDYSLGLEAGKVLRIDAAPVAAPLATELYRAALAVGAHPYVNELERLPELILAEGTEEQLDHVSPIATAELELVDAIVTVWSESNTRALSRADPGRHQRLIASTQQLAKRR
jgi:aminopeptidase